MVQLFQHTFIGTINKEIEPNVANIGTQMLGVNKSGYALPFEVVSMLLLAALIGCIVIAMKTPKGILNNEQRISNDEEKDK